MEQKKADILIVKLFEQRLSKKEAEQLEEWLKEKKHQHHFREFVEMKYALDTKEEFDFKKPLEEAKKRIREIQRRKRRRNLLKYAAILIVMLGMGGVLFLNNHESKRVTIQEEREIPVIVDNEIEIGEGKAILTLNDNTKVALGKESNYHSKNVSSSGEELEYNASGEHQETIQYNTLTVPRGGQFSVRLADGTKVWLNSESQLRYPVEFTTGEPRKVELIYGEAYFEVSPSEDHQGDHFIAIHEGIKAEVLGTEFNIKAYRDEENTYTTLAEGVVELQKDVDKVRLKPYQQAITKKTDKVISVEILTSLDELLWRKGEFSFKHKPLKEIMKVLSRWYDMEVIFESSSIKEVEFTGALGKEQSIEEIMNIIQKTNDINYEIQHKTLTLK